MIPTEAEAKERARALCKKLGPGWKPRTWEGTHPLTQQDEGWQFAAVSPCGGVHVQAREPGVASASAQVHITPRHLVTLNEVASGPRGAVSKLRDRVLAIQVGSQNIDRRARKAGTW